MNEEFLKLKCQEGFSIRKIANEVGKSETSVRHWLKKFNLKTQIAPCTKVSDDEIIKAFQLNDTMAGVFSSLKIKMNGGAYYHFKNRCVKLGLNFSKFSEGQRAGGKATAKIRNKQALVKNDRVSRSSLHFFLQENNIEEKCSVCNISHWQGKKLHLQIHHINHNRTDNRLDNLCYICPNCHSLEHYDGSGHKVKYS